MAFDGVSWSSYVALCDDIVSGATRITYDQGRMEIVTVSNRHERVRRVLTRLIAAYADASNTPVESLGSTTFRREDLQKGLEPDDCFYVANASVMFGMGDLDLSTQPAPDLAIEVDISPPDVSKQPIYAALGVGEIWRYTPERGVEFWVRTGPDYSVIETSRTFPRLTSKTINELLQIGLAIGQTAVAAELRRRVEPE